MKKNHFFKIIEKAIITGMLLCVISVVYPQSNLKSGSETIRFPSRENLPWADMPAESREYMEKSWKSHVLVLRSANAKLVEQQPNRIGVGEASRDMMTHLEEFYTNCGVDVKFDVYGDNIDIIDISPTLYADNATQGLKEATDFINTSETEGSALDQMLDNFASSHGISREDILTLFYVANNQGVTPGGGAYTNVIGHGFALKAEPNLGSESYRSAVLSHEMAKAQLGETDNQIDATPRKGYIYPIPTNPDGSQKYDFRENANDVDPVKELTTMSLVGARYRRQIPIASGLEVELWDHISQSFIKIRMGDEGHYSWKHGRWDRLEFYCRTSNVGIGDIETHNDINIYPNLGNGPITIDGIHNPEQEIIHVLLFDRAGRLVYDRDIGRGSTVSFNPNLAQGAYNIVVLKGGKRINLPKGLNTITRIR